MLVTLALVECLVITKWVHITKWALTGLGHLRCLVFVLGLFCRYVWVLVRVCLCVYTQYLHVRNIIPCATTTEHGVAAIPTTRRCSLINTINNFAVQNPTTGSGSHSNVPLPITYLINIIAWATRTSHITLGLRPSQLYSRADYAHFRRVHIKWCFSLLRGRPSRQGNIYKKNIKRNIKTTTKWRMLRLNGECYDTNGQYN